MLKLPKKTDGQTDTKILLDAMSNDKVHLARFILDALDGKIIDSKTEGAQTPLISSVFLPDSQTRSKFMNLLLQRGASVNCQDGSGRTALSYACEKGYLDAVKILVKNNADPEMVDSWGNTGLMYAAVAGHSLVVEFLVRAFKRLGIQIDRQNKVGNSAVEVAKYLGHTECLFALTSNSKKVHDHDCLTERLANMNIKADCNMNEEKPKRKPSDPSVEQRQDIHQMYPQNESSAPVHGAWLSVTSGRGKSLILRNRLQSMDSIEEFEGESDSLPSSPQGLKFSGILTPKPPSRSCNSKPGDKSTSADNHLPPLSRRAEHQISVLYSPRPSKSISKSCASTTSPGTLASPLGILLTPIVGNGGKDDSDKDKLKKTTFDFGIRRFDDSYYQKRCSLPTSALSPAPPERTRMPLRKSKTTLKNIGSSVNSESPDLTSPQVSTAFAVFGNKLLRRFTFPEFKKTGKEAQDGGCAAQTGAVELAARGMPRSETFPLSTNHPQVGSKPSIDSISAVKCEFDFQVKMASSKSNF